MTAEELLKKKKKQNPEDKNKNEQEVDKGGGDTQILKEISPTG